MVIFCISYMYIYIFMHVISKASITPRHIEYNVELLGVVQSLYSRSGHLYCFISMFLTKAAYCCNVRIALHLAALCYIYIYIVHANFIQNFGPTD